MGTPIIYFYEKLSYVIDLLLFIVNTNDGGLRLLLPFASVCLHLPVYLGHIWTPQACKGLTNYIFILTFIDGVRFFMCEPFRCPCFLL